MSIRSYALEQRLRFIDSLLTYYGKFNRSMLMDYFGISMPQASKDLQEYLKNTNDGVRYDLTARAYVTTPTFKRQYPGEANQDIST